MSTVEEKYIFTTVRETLIEKDWAAGPSEILDSTEFVISRAGGKYVARYGKVKYAPAWLKIIDEPIVNVLDHLVRCLGTSNPVTWMRVDFAPNGRVRISNNGPGIEVAQHTVASKELGRDVWVPELVFGEPFQGSNRKRADDSIIGGTNGLGAKLSNCFSTEFIVETVDTARQKFYIQRWHDKMAHRDPPKIINLSDKSLAPEKKEMHTTLSFMPDYKHFKYDEFTEETYKELSDVVLTRVIFAAAYAGYTCAISKSRQPFSVYYNGELVPISGINDIAAILFPGRTCIKTTIVPDGSSTYRYPWDVCAIINDQNDEPDSCPNQMSIVNGIVVRDGRHIKHLFSCIISGVSDKISKIFKDKNMKFKSSYVTDSVFLLANTKIPNPNWTGQRKDILNIDAAKLVGYTFDKKFIGGIMHEIEGHIVDEIFNEKAPAKTKQPLYKKYKGAYYCGHPKTAQLCRLLATEGDSAMDQLVAGITNNASMGFNYYGIISLGGVIVNVRKECTVADASNDNRKIHKSTKVINNVFINAFLGVTGLDLNYRYNPQSKTYKTEMSKLRYGGIIVCVDQDNDGVGNIFSLILNIFALFWPNLLAAGYVQRFNSPRIRAYPHAGGKVAEFYTDLEYANWVKALTAAGKTTNSWDIKYYKGLATHDREEVINMFKRFKENILTYHLDEKSHELFEVYYGVDTRPRKIALATPVEQPSDELIQQQLTTMKISCSDHLNYETKLFQKDSIERHLDHALDGQNQSGRMILHASQKAFQAKAKQLKVAQLAGFVSEHEPYHHGEDCLANTIIGKAFITVGGKQIPQLLPYGNFGSRIGGGDDAGKPRYIHTKLNKAAVDIIFPPEDYPLLTFEFVEGKRGPPKYYLPIIPMSIVESTELPGHGWKLKVWGRDIFKIIENVRRLIRIDDNARLLDMPPNTFGWKGKIKTICGEPYSFGSYSYNEQTNCINITELPLRVWTKNYCANLFEKISSDGNVIEKINDNSDDQTINIIVQLKPNAMEWLNNNYQDLVYTDPVEEYFMLRDHMYSHLNMIGSRGEVLEFKKYEDIIHYWFPFRKIMYSDRVRRQKILLRAKITYYENTLRYIKTNDIKLDGLTISQMEELLAAREFARIHKGKIFKPKFVAVDELEDLIFRGPKANHYYLLDLTGRHRSKENIEELTAAMNVAKDKLAALLVMENRGRFVGAAIWEAELDKLEQVVIDGRNTNWRFGEKGKYYFE